MRGGELLIDGEAGDELGAVMRRGLIAVGGRIGAFAAAGMVAGSVFAFGPVGQHAGAGMKRGTVVTFGPAPELLPTFPYDCSYRPAFIDLYLRRLAALGFTVPAIPERSAAIGVTWLRWDWAKYWFWSAGWW